MRKVWMARVGSAGNWRIVGEQDESGRAEKREPNIATKKGTVNVRSARFLVNQFFALRDADDDDVSREVTS
jgi:hypothetical protein